jgi:hypothetical protein
MNIDEFRRGIDTLFEEIPSNAEMVPSDLVEVMETIMRDFNKAVAAIGLTNSIQPIMNGDELDATFYRLGVYCSALLSASIGRSVDRFGDEVVNEVIRESLKP